MRNKLPIYGFMHCCAINDYKEIINGQVNKMFSSGLYHACEKISVGVLGKYDVNIFSKLPKKFCVEYQSSNIKEYEFPTLKLLYERCTKEDCLVWYVHTKGVFNNRKRHYRYGDQTFWRKNMEILVLEKWKNCVDILEKFNYQTCGACYDGSHKRFGRIYTGNFWWARGSYVRRLINPANCDTSQRHWAEGWLLCNDIKDSNIAIDIGRYVKNKS